MKNRYALSAVFFALTFAATAAWAHQHAKAAAIELVNQEFEAAMGAGSAERLAAIYTSDGQLLPTNSPIIYGAENIRSFWQAAIDQGIGGVDLETVELDVIGETAIEVGQYDLKDADGGSIDKGKFIVVWKMEDGQWKYHRDMFSSSVAVQQ